MDQTFTNFTGLDTGNNNLGLFPNPAAQAINIQIESQLQERVELKVMDTQGKTIKLLALDLGEGFNLMELPIQDIPSGTYFVQVSGTDLLLQDKFIKL